MAKKYPEPYRGMVIALYKLEDVDNIGKFFSAKRVYDFGRKNNWWEAAEIQKPKRRDGNFYLDRAVLEEFARMVIVDIGNHTKNIKAYSPNSKKIERLFINGHNSW
jgi:hypothetical protein